MKVYIQPYFDGPDKGEGGIKRVYEAQCKYLPEHGIEVTRDAKSADLIALHAGEWVNNLPTSVPVVTHCHGLYWSEYQWDRWHHLTNKDVVAALRRADVVTAPSEWVANALRRGMGLSPVVLGHGVEASEWAGRFDRADGYVLWNKTRVDQVCDPMPVWELASRARDIHFISTLGKSGRNIDLIGRLPFVEAADYVQRAGVYLATAKETFGIGTLEAMACGVPILGWKWGGQAEFVRHKESGYLASVGDYSDLEVGLRYCIQHRTRLGLTAQQDVAAHHALPRVMARYADLYRGLIDGTDLASPSHFQSKNGGVKISVIIPCYNLGRYLEGCIRSVRQSEGFDDGDIEIIVIDDASTDNSRELIQQVSERYVFTALWHKNNEHVSRTLNDGYRLASGKYIMALDADNELTPGALGVLYSALEQSRDLDIAYGAIRFVREDGTPNEEVGEGGISGWPPKVFLFEQQMEFPKSQIPSSALCRRKVWERTGGYRERIKNGVEDVDFWCRAVSAGCIPGRVTSAPTLVYRMREDSLSTVRGWKAGKDWTQWYPWAKDDKVRPFGVPVSDRRALRVPSYSEPKVSVVIPVGPGHERLVIDALDSLVAQTYEGWEAIVVNDTGRDLPVKLPPWALQAQSKGKVGPGGARNIGVAIARASNVVFLDADDYLAPRALEMMLWARQKYGGYVYSDWFTVAADGSERYHEAFEWDAEVLLQVGEMPWPITGMYAREDVERVGGFSSNAQVEWEDWDFLLKLHEAGVCGLRVPEPLLYFRIAEGQRHLEMLGERREVHLEQLRSKWRPYFEGKEKLMACGCSAGRKVTSAAIKGGLAKSVGGGGGAALMSGEIDEGMVLMEYTGGASSYTINGPVTRTVYTFKPRRQVFAADVEGLLRHPKLVLLTPVEA